MHKSIILGLLFSLGLDPATTNTKNASVVGSPFWMTRISPYIEVTQETMTLLKTS